MARFVFHHSLRPLSRHLVKAGDGMDWGRGSPKFTNHAATARFRPASNSLRDMALAYSQPWA
jgi:hypothetical protein